MNARLRDGPASNKSGQWVRGQGNVINRMRAPWLVAVEGIQGLWGSGDLDEPTGLYQERTGRLGFRALPVGLATKSQGGMGNTHVELWRHRPLLWGMLWSSNEAGASRCHHQAVLASAAAGVGGKCSRENEALGLTTSEQRLWRLQP